MGSIRHPIYDHIDDPLHTTVFAYWLSQRGGRDMPRSDAIDLRTIAGVVPDLGMIWAYRDRLARDPAGRRGMNRARRRGACRFLQGQVPAGCEAFYPGVAISGSMLPQLRQLDAVCREVCRSAAPVYTETVLWFEHRGHAWANRLVLPLRGRDGKIDSLLYSLRFVPRLGGGTWSAERNGVVKEAVEVKRIVYESFAVTWTEREFVFRCLAPREDEIWMAYGGQEIDDA